jgi:hypothetical protein
MYVTKELQNKHTVQRKYKKKDGTLCDYSAPRLMIRRAAETTQTIILSRINYYS